MATGPRSLKKPSTEGLPVEQQHILSLIGKARRESKGWHESIARWRRLYNFDQYDKPPRRNETQFKDPTYTNVVDLTVGILLANRMDFRAYGWQSDMVEEDRTSKIEKYLRGLIDINSLREEMDIEYQILLNFARDGAGVVYSVWDPEDENYQVITVPDENEGSKQVYAYMEPPICTQVIDPITIQVMEGGPHRWQVVARTERRSIADIEDEYGIQLEDFRHLKRLEKMSWMGEFVDYWDIIPIEEAMDYFEAEEEEAVEGLEYDPESGAFSYFGSKWVVRNATIYNNRFLDGPRNMPGYKNIPYTIGFFKPVANDHSEDWGHSVIRPMETSIQLLTKMINRRSTQIDKYSDMPMVSWTRPGRSVQIDPGMSRLAQLQTDERLGYPEWPGNAPDVEEQIGYLRSKVQQSGFSDVMFGSGANQVSGYALSQLGDQNRIRLEQPVRHLELMWTLWAQKVMELSSFFSPDHYIRVYGRRKGRPFTEQLMGKDMLDYKVECYVKPEFPDEKQRNHVYANQMRDVLSRRTIGENYLGIEQWDDEEDRLMEDMIAKHPAMIQYAIVSELQLAAESGDKAAEVVLQQIMNGGLSGMPGRPNEPGRPEPPGGGFPTQSPDQVQPGAAGEPPPGQGVSNLFNNLLNRFGRGQQ